MSLSSEYITELNEGNAQTSSLQYVAQAKKHAKNEEWVDATENYKRAIALSPTQVWLYLALGPILVAQDRLDEATDCYKIAHSLNPKKSRTYVLMGIALEKQEKKDKAIKSYQQALLLEPEQPDWVYQKLGNALSERAFRDYKESAFRYAQVMCRRDRFGHLNLLNETLSKIFGLSNECNEQSIRTLFQDYTSQDPKTLEFMVRLTRLGFVNPGKALVNPAGYYIINEKLKAVYCSIPKNACTLFKTMMVEHSELKESFELSGETIHRFLSQRARDVGVHHLLDCLDSDEYFKFVVLRAPFERLVSGYLDKFAKHERPEPFVQEVIMSVQHSLGTQRDVEQSITFEQFVDYLVRTPDEQLNDHWKPQTNFVASVGFDFVGQFESLDAVRNLIEQTLNIDISENVSAHATQYYHFEENKEGFHSLSPHQLRNLPGLPTASNLLTSCLQSKLCSRFPQEIAMYKSIFRTTTTDRY